MRTVTHREKQAYRNASNNVAPYALIQKWPWWLGQFTGLTLGPLILVKRDDLTLVCHELVHVEQFYKQPFTFWVCYLWHLWRKGYLNNPYEIEAREIESRVKDSYDKGYENA